MFLCRSINVRSPFWEMLHYFMSSGSTIKRRERDSLTWINGSAGSSGSLPGRKEEQGSLSEPQFILLLISLKATLVFNTCAGTII